MALDLGRCRSLSGARIANIGNGENAVNMERAKTVMDSFRSTGFALTGRNVMIYKRGEYGISVEQINGFGKNPGLWIHKGNSAIKMASFGSKEKAEEFIRYLDWLVLINAKEPEEKDGEIA